jgi:hypothetical protein
MSARCSAQRGTTNSATRPISTSASSSSGNGSCSRTSGTLGTNATLDEIQDRSKLDELLGRLAVDGTPDVQAKLDFYAGVRNVVLASLMIWLQLDSASAASPDELPPALGEAWRAMLQSTPTRDRTRSKRCSARCATSLRHSCASIFSAAGVNAKALSSYLGHASVTITYDRYGHLMPGSEDEAVKLVDDYIERTTGERAVSAH